MADAVMTDHHADQGAPPTPRQPVGPGHYAVLGVHQGASNALIMEAYDALEKETIHKFSNNEPTDQELDARDERLEEIRNAARVLNNPVTRSLHDKELRGVYIDWDAERRAPVALARNTYEDLDNHHRRNNSNERRHTDSYRPSIYPDIWIAVRDGRDWPVGPGRLGGSYRPPRSPLRFSLPSPKVHPRLGYSPVYYPIVPKTRVYHEPVPWGRPSPTYSPYVRRNEADNCI